MHQDDWRLGLYVLVVIVLALWLEDRVKHHVNAGVIKSTENGRAMERWIHGETSRLAT